MTITFLRGEESTHDCDLYHWRIPTNFRAAGLIKPCSSIDAGDHKMLLTYTGFPAFNRLKTQADSSTFSVNIY